MQKAQMPDEAEVDVIRWVAGQSDLRPDNDEIAAAALHGWVHLVEGPECHVSLSLKAEHWLNRRH